MNNLFNRSDADNIIQRLNKLTPDSKRSWGVMTVSQMLAHCNISIETAMGLNFPERKLIGRIFGKLLKRKFLNSEPMIKNSLTEDLYITTGELFEFEIERERSIKLILAFYQNGPQHCTDHPHSYFGKLTPHEWSVLKWKHYDHHLRQFGV